MKSRFLLSLCALGLCFQASSFGQTVVGQSLPTSQSLPVTHPATPVVPATRMSFGDQQDQDETAQQALAKTLDEFHQRLKSLEESATQLTEAQAEGSFLERIEGTESGIRSISETIDEIDASLDDKVSAGHGEQRMRASGRVHSDYWAFTKDTPGIVALEGGDPQDRFGFRRLRFGFHGDVNDNMLYKIEMEFAGGNDVEFRDAYLGFKDLACFNTVLIGNQKRPYGLDHLNSSRYNVFMERPFAIEAFNQDARRLGIASYGVSDDRCTNWRFGVFNMDLIQDVGNYVGDHYQLEGAGRLARTWWWDAASDGRGYGHVAISGSMGVPDGLGANNQARYRTRPEARSTNHWLDTGVIAGAKAFGLVGVESVVNVGPLQIVGEYQLVDVDRFDFFGSRVFLHGGYIYASYFLTGEHIPWNRDRGVLGRVKPFENFFSVCDCDGFRQMGRGAWQIAARLSYADLTDENIIGGRGTSGTIGLNWHWNPYARMQFNYIFGDIDRQLAGGGSYQIAGVRFMIDF